MESKEATSKLDIELPGSISLCHSLINTLLEMIKKSESKINRLEQSIDNLLRHRFGRKSERLEDIDPALLLPFMQDYLQELKAQQQTDEEPAIKPEKETISYTRNKPRRRNIFPENLERRQVIHDLDEEEKICSCCGRQMQMIGQIKSEQLDYIPAQILVIEHIRNKYACKHKDCEAKVATAIKPAQPIEKGIAAAGLLAHVAVSKYLDHLPLYRIEKIFQRHDIDITRSTMCGWMMGVADLLTPLYKLMKSEVLKAKVIKTDDTPVQVQDKTHPRGSRKGRLWIYSGDKSYPYYIYDYTCDRSSDGPKRFLHDYRSGFIQADAYAGYDFIFDDKDRTVKELLCWAHARRKFYEARKTAPALSATALAWIKQLYQVEKQAKDKTSAQRYRLRQDKSVKLLADFKQWLEGVTMEQALPQSPFRQAINYADNGWQALCRYTSDGDFDIDNNQAERQMRPVAIGRKNWLFFGSDRGGHAAAILMSLVQSAKRHNLNPYRYLKDIIQSISDTPINHLPHLLPNNWQPTSNT